MQFIVGIDLGTTNCAVAYIAIDDLKKRPDNIQIFNIPQLTRPGVVEPRPLLPSFLYVPGASELPKGSTALPWDEDNKIIVGELARNLGAKVPGRLVASAKSWLCSPSVDRTAAILPWGAPEDVKRVSPVEASAKYLAHIRAAWDHEIAGRSSTKKLAAQEIMLTVPASFDEAARELTVEAAKLAGLPNIRLLEEPQAAFYAWISAHAKEMERELSGINRVLVCDVGGGTTDYSLIDVQRTGDPRNPVELKRSAVGDHLMLGGDNMDLALARFLEKKVTGTLDAHQFKALTAAAREGKERIFGENAPQKVPITIMGRGTSVIGGSVRTELLKDEAAKILVDGFFPLSNYGEDPTSAGRTGIREWGLPYVHDPAVTRHMSQFLRHHSSLPAAEAGSKGTAPARPDAVLFNGGAMKPEAFRKRILGVLQNWFSPSGNWQPKELHNPSLDLAVAIGAAYYGCARHGAGVRIGGGMGRAYFIGIETEPEPGRPSGKAAICLVPQGTEEGQMLELPQTFVLRLATPVVFPLFSSSVRGDDKLGTIIDENTKELAPLPPLETMLHAGRRAVKKDVGVRLQVSLTEVGTLALALKSIGDERKWEVHLNVRSRIREMVDDTPKDAGVGADPRKVEAAMKLIARAFDPQSREPLPPGMLTKQMEGALELSKEAWPAALARKMADLILALAEHRKRSAEHETRWLNLIGFLLRPGFGDIADQERLRKLYNATRNGLNFVSDPNTRIEWWVLWRRVSGGLKEDHERELFYKLQPFLTNDRDITKRGGWPRPSKGEVPEMWRAAASLELLDRTQKKMLGDLILDELEDEGPSTAMLWAIGRIGARDPAHAPANVAVPAEMAEAWLKRLLAIEWAGNPLGVFAAVSLARKTGDRTRDIGEPLRGKVLERIKKAGATEHDIAAVKTVTALENADRKTIFGDALPPALKLEA